ncbi:hypothetical protein LINGRAHAP2_LOCUS16595 [Linum grandiflorum]
MRRFALLPLIRSQFSRRISSSSTAANNSIPPDHPMLQYRHPGRECFQKVMATICGVGVVATTTHLCTDDADEYEEKNEEEEKDGVIAYNIVSPSRVRSSMGLLVFTAGLSSILMIRQVRDFGRLGNRFAVPKFIVGLPFFWVSSFTYLCMGREIQKIRWEPGADSFEVEWQTRSFKTVTEKINLKDVCILGAATPPRARFFTNGKRYELESTARLNKDLVARLASSNHCDSCTCTCTCTCSRCCRR